ncbi:helix-turn-helix transcriptional regulator [Actinoplanes sp. LDG1-06]|uniref:Helix-turn-helix transcriptional regulator n=1 Tax=Paractinoplanes ovalisporus TaxID=2810368 RepID=A0ABS2AK81_9ACTN|nr:helix-turn-helix transcriptional regulator [Actinoplanes ovalisporus]MBM2620178.1 helix-turn-helix transcriptional regulator [Actinoplanes ovalisporus]
MAVETFGQALRRLRADLSVRELARRAHLDAGHLSRIENGRRQPSPELALALDQALGAGGGLVALLPPVAEAAEPWRLDSGLWRPADSERLAAAVVAERPTAENAVSLAHQWLIAEPPQLTAIRAGRRIGVEQVEQVEARVHQLRLLDDHVGGADTHDMVTAELTATTALLRDGAYSEDVGRRLLVAVGELCQLAGWTLSDAGAHDRAEAAYLLGVRAAHAGGDVAGAANNLSSLAYQVANVGDAREAVTLARSAYVGARGEASATTRALLAERVAWSAARAGEARDAERALGTVEAEYDHRRPGDDPIWTYWLDEGEIEIMAGRVWTELARPLRAVPILEQATAGYGEDTGRETSLYLTWLAESLLQANEVERAADAATRALRLSRNAGSARADDRVAELRRRLGHHRGNPAADAFEDEAATPPA